MAERKKSRRRSGRARRAGVPIPRRSWELLSRLRKPQAEFKEDSGGTDLIKLLHVTETQRLRLLRWGLYILVCLMALVIQDVIMSRIHILGATTDLAVAAILLIAVLEGSEKGGIFALLASIVYYFGGTAPGPYCVGFITVLSVLLNVFRQQYWHRSSGSIILCSGIAIISYELLLYITGLFLGLTRWDRIQYFLLAGIYSTLVTIPLYQLVYRIGLIGGNSWKE